MNDKAESKSTDPVLTLLAVIGWILPLAGLVWGPGTWWQYLIWLVIGTAVILAYESR